jgi:hypothetical protein
MMGMAVMPAVGVGELWGGLSLMAPNKTAGAIILAGAAWHTAVWTAALAMAGVSAGVSVAAAIALTL